ncbi:MULTISPECIES: lipocalin-like domain-containing protein [Ruegeria]|uniref:lipocalin-like domain-containing protein n=1 Tax=Ruegeria TaxID=97050 RepID=UPI00147CCB82|nr:MULTISPECIES: lipocalin-like domain-containing protein [Ruegeria]NOD48881.1 hypothetical protein [Ruegeria sp. HKCCD5849]NOD53528.1 hypothetical protein [Ruegeria sp. HKCCD5851]NOD70203.1 hypothetical protein [Ruegeria sp. HKCCD7303]
MSANVSIIGTWVLKSFVAEFDDGSTLQPYGDNPQGRIVYAGDGFMSAHLWNPDTHVEGTNSRDYPSYFSYCGDWSIEGEVVRHRVHASTEASWAGQDKLRTMASIGELLELTAEEVVFGGKEGRGILVWERLKN